MTANTFRIPKSLYAMDALRLTEPRSERLRRSAETQLREIQLFRVHPELVFGIQLHIGHRFEFRCVEGWKLGFGRGEFLEVFAGVGESVVIGVADFAIR